MPAFVPGLRLARDFYETTVRPLVGIPHAAALLGEGSEVLGFDQARSTDHAWGPRLQLFVAGPEIDALAARLERDLPETFAGWPVRFFSWQSNSVRHHVEVGTLGAWTAGQTGFDLTAGELSVPDWLAMPQQVLLQLTAGEVFHDDEGVLRRLREDLRWYPRDVWLWAMASQWHLIGNAEPRLGRMLEAGDLRGARLAAAGLTRLLMELAFLQERSYWPYEKWFGTAFSRLAAAPTLGPLLDRLLDAQGDPGRTEALHAALRVLAERHNGLGLTQEVAISFGHFEVGVNAAVRPYRVLDAGRFVQACRQAIQGRALRDLATVGTFDQLTHADDVLVNFSPWPRRLADVYRTMLGDAP